ncbi:MAG: hypothetical protein AAFV33_02570 [Chloroflexota bacterium]
MAVDAVWHNNEQTIIHFRFRYPWTVEQFLDLNAEVGAEIALLPHIVDAIFDFTDALTIPPEAVKGFRRAAHLSVGAPNQGISVMFGNRMLPLVVKVVRVVVPGIEDQVFVVEDMEQALAKVHEVQASRTYEST